MPALAYLQERGFTDGLVAVLVNPDLEPFAHETASLGENDRDFVRNVASVALKESAAGIFLVERRSGSTDPSQRAKSIARSFVSALAETDTHFLDSLTFDGTSLCSSFGRLGKGDIELLWRTADGR